ncbi:MAG: hypothetical protein LWW81_14105, partial [Rhodocyclales bacterium]|nr:hypothetical protein [Rhodocyclales bacterium]
MDEALAPNQIDPVRFATKRGIWSHRFTRYSISNAIAAGFCQTMLGIFPCEPSDASEKLCIKPINQLEIHRFLQKRLTPDSGCRKEPISTRHQHFYGRPRKQAKNQRRKARH